MSVIRIENNWPGVSHAALVLRYRARVTNATPAMLRKAIAKMTRYVVVEGRSTGAAIALAKNELPSVRATRSQGVVA